MPAAAAVYELPLESVCCLHLVELDRVEGDCLALTALELESPCADLANCVDHVLLGSSPFSPLLVEILKGHSVIQASDKYKATDRHTPIRRSLNRPPLHGP